MGQSTTIAAAFASAIILFGIFMNISTGLKSIESISSTVDQETTQFELLSGQRCKIESWMVLNATTLTLNVTNTGELSIRLPEFDSQEIYVMFSSNGSTRTARLPFNENATAGG